MLVARAEEAKERFMEVYKEEKRNVKRCIYQSKIYIRRKMNQDVNGNRKLIWKEASNARG